MIDVPFLNLKNRLAAIQTACLFFLNRCQVAALRFWTTESEKSTKSDKQKIFQILLACSISSYSELVSFCLQHSFWGQIQCCLLWRGKEGVWEPGPASPDVWDKLRMTTIQMLCVRNEGWATLWKGEVIVGVELWCITPYL